ncbi:hypothetical protein WR25_08884 [Diploscapter pachys]|uniref:Uncharacterized protein n=1 Tax=Diploscapter pachys TaxID=2018661 RepID=A0A2A2JB77_9BILA|nr:hypothetical protein WR25_08884 [Diploscapter pachys]
MHIFDLKHRLSKYSHYGPFALRVFFTICLAYGLISLYDSVFLFRSSKLSPEFRHLQTLQKSSSNGECKVPRLDPWDASIIKYFEKPKPLECRAVQKQLVKFLRDGVLEFDPTMVESISCEVTPFYHNNGVSDSEVVYGTPEKLDFTKSNRFQINHEFIEVTCKSAGVLAQEIYKYHFAQVISKNQTRVGNKAYPILRSSNVFPPVVMIGLDSMSRSNFMRQLPLTYQTLQALDFIDMMNHVKIGDNTYVNWLAILTGKRGVSSREFKAEMDESWNIAFDQFDMIWKNFSRNGYATLFAEDRPDIATFNYFGYLYGFRNTPVDHYFRPFWLAAYWSSIARRSNNYCYDDNTMFKIQLGYLEDFIKKYDNRRHFAYWWTQDMSHDYLNKIGMMDEDLNDFFVRNKKLLDDSIVIVFSDHGHRYDKIRETVIGRLEARMPFLSIKLPTWVRKNHRFGGVMDKLMENSGKLTTQFDLNESLNEIAWGNYLKPFPLRTSHVKKQLQRAHSIFHTMPKKRMCREANVPDDICVCYSETEIPRAEAQQPADAFMKGINELLKTADNEAAYDQDGNSLPVKKNYTCLPLKLKSINYASIRLPPPKLIDDPQTGQQVPLVGIEIQYRLVVKTQSPSDALIEGIVVKNFDNNEWIVTGEIERNNAYGNSSHCVVDRKLKLICHCVLSSKNENEGEQAEN